MTKQARSYAHKEIATLSLAMTKKLIAIKKGREREIFGQAISPAHDKAGPIALF